VVPDRWTWRDSNSPPTPCQSVALPDELQAQGAPLLVNENGRRNSWWTWGDSNALPPECETGVLPAELQAQVADHL
jgi:hypothetical protein